VTVVRREIERREQVALFRWAAMHAGRYPELRLLFAVPNGMPAKSAIAVRKMKAEGLRNGVPDVWLPVRRNSCSGLVLELKVPPNDLAEDQDWWARELRLHGWWVVAPCWGCDHAVAAIVQYLGDQGPIGAPDDYKAKLQRRYGLLRGRNKAGIPRGLG
jgi:VRR-NUC domain